jgi:hypothetical protein
MVMVEWLKIGIAVVVIGVSGYLLWKKQKEKKAEPPTEKVEAEIVPEDPNKKV